MEVIGYLTSRCDVKQLYLNKHERSRGQKLACHKNLEQAITKISKLVIALNNFRIINGYSDYFT